MRLSFRLLAGAVSALVLTGCTAPPAPLTPSSPAPSGPTATTATGEPLTRADAARCPVTRPRPFEPPPGVSSGTLFGASSAHGNDRLWVGGLGDDGIIAVGSHGMKFGWYRITPGRLVITGRRLDAAAPPARSSVPDGYGDSGFQSSGVIFPTPGCWEITGTVGAATLTFVTFVLEG